MERAFGDGLVSGERAANSVVTGASGECGQREQARDGGDGRTDHHPGSPGVGMAGFCGCGSAWDVVWATASVSGFPVGAWTRK